MNLEKKNRVGPPLKYTLSIVTPLLGMHSWSRIQNSRIKNFDPLQAINKVSHKRTIFIWQKWAHQIFYKFSSRRDIFQKFVNNCAGSPLTRTGILPSLSSFTTDRAFRPQFCPLFFQLTSISKKKGLYDNILKRKSNVFVMESF